VDSAANIYPNVNELYMAGLMTAPMVLIELVVMRGMYADKRLNRMIGATAVVLGVACFALIRAQAAVTDVQFLRSMIPHHAGAQLMCDEAPIRDGEVRELCVGITSSQQSEIDQMKAILSRLEN
jgi:uncharacterized protein (DUF305 family)